MYGKCEKRFLSVSFPFVLLQVFRTLRTKLIDGFYSQLFCLLKDVVLLRRSRLRRRSMAVVVIRHNGRCDPLFVF